MAHSDLFYSIIIPVYNRPDEVKELLEGLTDQEYTKFEVIIVEDGSTNDSKAVVDQFRQKLELRYFQKVNEGQGFARNFGFQRARGDYFIVFDSDCLIPKQYLQVVSNYLKENPLDAFGGPDCAHYSFTAVQKVISYTMTSPLTTGGIRGNKNHIGAFHPRSFNMGISREVFEATKGYRITRMGEDIEFSIRIASKGFSIGLITDAYVYHKRRTDFSQFYRQLHFFGRARVNIWRFFPDQLKLVHLFPMLFFIGFLFLPLSFAIQSTLGWFHLSAYLLYFICIFIHATVTMSSLILGFMSIVAAGIQLTAYGVGFLTEFTRGKSLEGQTVKQV
ncbi:MAG: glycosyltransferase [Cyclobacteriaceae bacterium]|nr:glycosyltransferase [Cyclobacteriaceae bacterium]MCH8516724.1 glycosyltransferase [Cyclobacteriaceae bacterium]